MSTWHVVFLSRALRGFAVSTVAVLPLLSGMPGLGVVAHADTANASTAHASTAHALAANAIVAQGPAGAQPLDPALVQQVAADEILIDRGHPVAMHAGHADFGPLLTAEGLRLMVRDDSVIPPVWRDPDDVVFVLGDSAAATVPGGQEYALTGAAGKKVWTIGQNQQADVPRLGWNTQAPSFLQTNPQGMRLSFDGHTGPGPFSLFVQSGGFQAPTALVDSRSPLPQDLWIEPNTHVHANWVFAEPGAHVLTISATPEGPAGAGQPVSAHLRFAVGGTDPQEVLALKPQVSVGDAVTSTNTNPADAIQANANPANANPANANQAKAVQADATRNPASFHLALYGVGAVAGLVCIAAAAWWSHSRRATIAAELDDSPSGGAA